MELTRATLIAQLSMVQALRVRWEGERGGMGGTWREGMVRLVGDVNETRVEE